MSRSPDRRRLLAGLAALPIAAPAAAATPDPVLGMLTREQELWAWYNAGGSDEELYRRGEVHDAHEQATFATAPTTLAGLAALVDLFVERECFDMWEPGRYLRQIADHARALGGVR